MSVFDVGFPDPFFNGFIGNEDDDDLDDNDDLVIGDDDIDVYSRLLEWSREVKACQLLCVATTPAAQGFVDLHFTEATRLSTNHNSLHFVKSVSTVNGDHDHVEKRALLSATELTTEKGTHVFVTVENERFIEDVHYNHIATKLLEYCNDNTRILILCSGPVSSFSNLDGHNNEEDSFLRSLVTSREERLPSVKLLERPNIVFGIPAALMTKANARNLSALLLILYHTDHPSFDSLSLNTFDALFNSDLAKKMGLAKATITQDRMKRIQKENIATNMFL